MGKNVPDLVEAAIEHRKLLGTFCSKYERNFSNHEHFLVLHPKNESLLIEPLGWVLRALDPGWLKETTAISAKVGKQKVENLGFKLVKLGDPEFSKLWDDLHDWIKENELKPLSEGKGKERKERTYFWIKYPAINDKTVGFDEIAAAFEKFDNKGIPDGFREAQKWFVAHPDTGQPYPAKITWGLATSQRGVDFTAHQARDALRKCGFECAALDPSDFAPEISQTDPLIEGAEHQATRTIRERNPVARKRCIDHYLAQNDGRLACLACDTSFNEIYGELGEGFIHVHHLNPLAKAEGERIVSPEFDLVPICPNCHAMIHRHGKTRSITEIIRLLKQNPH